jgi:hypothetical protein
MSLTNFIHPASPEHLERDDFLPTQSAHGEEGLSLSKHVLSACKAVEGTRLEPPAVLRDEPSTSSVSPQDERINLKSSCSRNGP